MKLNPERYVNFSIINTKKPYSEKNKKIMTISKYHIFIFIFVFNYLFFRNLKIIISSINLGKDINRSDRKLDRWMNMIRGKLLVNQK